MTRQPALLKVKAVARKCLYSANRVGAGLDRLMQKTGDKPPEPLFIVGLPRSGTTLVYEIIIQAFKVAYFSKIYSYTYGMPNLTTRLCSVFMRNPRAYYRSRYGSLPGLFSPAENHTFWMKWFPERPVLGHHVAPMSLSENDVREMNQVLSSISNIAGRPFVFKDVYLSLSLEALLDSIDRSRVLVVTREHEAISASVFKRRSELLQQGHWWSIRPPFCEEVMERDLIEQVAFQCTRSEQLMQQQLSDADPARYRIVDYKEVCQSPLAFVERIRDWLGAEFEPRRHPDVPSSFEVRRSQGFPDGIRREYAQFSTALRDDKEHYLDRVRSELPDKQGTDRAHL